MSIENSESHAMAKLGDVGDLMFVLRTSCTISFDPM